MKKKILLTVTMAVTALLCGLTLSGQNQNKPDLVAGIPVNYDESKAGSYILPDPLVAINGKTITKAGQWLKQRRPEILALFEQYQYGRVPGFKEQVTFKVFDTGTPVFDGKAIRRQVTIYFTDDTAEHHADLLLYLPPNSNKPVPLFLNVSFVPNATVVDDPGIRGGFIYSKDGKKVPVQRGGRFGKTDPMMFLNEGIGYATIYYGDIEPDFADGYKYGIRGHYLQPGESYPAPDNWGAISAWSWGLSKAMDYLVTDKQVDNKKIALFGVSRLGKTVLWTGCRDQRFGMVISSCSGEGGAALSRRLYGETIDHMTHPTRYFYQFAGNWRNYAPDPSKSPVDAHMLISLMAPRPLLLQTGDTDRWSDPKGEFEAAKAAGPVYLMFGKRPLDTDTWPQAGTPILNDLGYYMHSGGHGALPADYEIFIKFMKLHFLAAK